MNHSEDVLQAAYKHTSDHRSEVEASTVCLCFYCLDNFSSEDIQDWLSEGSGTAICPFCQIDAVIGDRSGFPVQLSDFARAMHERWFERSDKDCPASPMLAQGVSEQPEPLQSEADDDFRRHFTPEQIESIERGLADSRAGRTVSNEEMFADIRAKYGW